jgi:hypothetical protein
MTQKLQQLQEAIREVCTELVIGHYQGEQEPLIEMLPIELQHILRAMNEKHTGIYYVLSDGSFYNDNDLFRDSIVGYDLTKPLDQQAPEVIDFLHSIICKG